MWRVQSNFNLPNGFELWEEEDVVELRYKGKGIALFRTRTATPSAILKRCKEYVGERGMQDA